MQVGGAGAAPGEALASTWERARAERVAIPRLSRWALRSQMAAILALLTLMIVIHTLVVIRGEAELGGAHAEALTAQRAAAGGLRLEAAVRRQDAALQALFATRDPVYAADYDSARLETGRALDALRAATGGGSRATTVRLGRELAAWQQWADGRRMLGPRAAGQDAAENRTGELLAASVSQEVDRVDLDLERRAAAADAVVRAASARLVASAELTALGILVVILLVAALFFRSVLRPMSQLVAAAAELAVGHRVTLPGLRRTDEVGRLARALDAWNRWAQDRLELARSMAAVADQEALPDVLSLGAQRIKEELGAAQVVIHLSIRHLWRVAHSSPLEYAGQVMMADAPEADALRSRRAVAGDLRAQRWDPTLRAWQALSDYGPVLSVPLLSGRQVLGTATAIRRLNQSPFSALDHELAEIVIPPLATAIHVALLRQDGGLQRPADVPTQISSRRPPGRLTGARRES